MVNMPLLTKITGIGLIIFGLAIIIFFTTAAGHQPIAIGNAVVIFGIFLMGLGFLLFLL
ncbi:MAG: hypothetical protein QXE34_01075 [Candidatus Aenigmatarchaeota archaeon]